jgi:hypothetical protein
MSYSRRQLYALGEPLGDSATYRKADGGLVLGDGGGGGGGGQPANTTSQTTQTQDLPDWAKPYAQDVLSKGKAVTDISQNPYQAYGGQRIAEFAPLQQQAQTGAAGITTGPAGFQRDVGGYMNPYLQMALAPQLAEANRQYGITGAQQQAAATQAGAFGGGRQALMAAENERNRNMALQNILGQGYNTAFQQAQNQYNQGFGQNLQAIGLQSQLGAQQQAQQQKGLDIGYQDFLTQKNYPYQQLSYMANLVRGTPMGMNTQSQVYQAPPTGMQTLGALGLGAYGLGKMFADGGEVKTYAGNKGSVTSEDNVRSISKFLPQQQLPTSYQLAQARNDMDAQIALQKQMAENASIQRGLGSAFNALPPETQDGVVRAAGGGILAFAGDDEDNDPVSGQLISSPGNPALYNQSLLEAMRYNQAIGKFKGTTMTPEEEQAYVQRQYNLEKGLAGPNTAADQFRAYLQGAEGDRASALEQSKGLGALQAAAAILQPGGTIRGLGAAGSAFAGEYSKGLQADRAMKHQLAMANFNLADAERKERMGYTKSAMESLAKRQANLQAADKLQLDVLKSQGSTAARIAQAARPIKTGAGGEKLPQVDRLAGQIANQIVDLKQKDPNDPQIKVLESKLTGLKDVMAAAKISDVGPGKTGIETSKLLAGAAKDAADAARKSANMQISSEGLLGDKSPKAAARVKEIRAEKYREELGKRTGVLGKSIDEIITETGGIPSFEDSAAPANKTKGGSGTVTRSNF